MENLKIQTGSYNENGNVLKMDKGFLQGRCASVFTQLWGLIATTPSACNGSFHRCTCEQTSHPKKGLRRWCSLCTLDFTSGLELILKLLIISEIEKRTVGIVCDDGKPRTYSGCQRRKLTFISSLKDPKKC